MKNTIIAASVVFGLFSVNAIAADGQISFTGSIDANTCMVNSGTNDFAVNLGAVPASALSNIGDIAGNQAFDMALTGCAGGATKVAAKFESLDLGANGFLKLNSASTASEVVIGIWDQSGAHQPINGVVPASSYVDIASGSATLSYVAAYKATGEAQVGSANSQVAYTLSYQ
ncbi:fimbrial protein [Aeromonas salmonicida]|uniref:fimbrial protein n=1 Tax=Aeromonas salmonicida TaxID=645 RepID=UPI002240B96C|nr:fimbrial protein [Aeromonas salmonicida]